MVYKRLSPGGRSILAVSSLSIWHIVTFTNTEVNFPIQWFMNSVNIIITWKLCISAIQAERFFYNALIIAFSSFSRGDETKQKAKHMIKDDMYWELTVSVWKYRLACDNKIDFFVCIVEDIDTNYQDGFFSSCVIGLEKNLLKSFFLSDQWANRFFSDQVYWWESSVLWSRCVRREKQETQKEEKNLFSKIIIARLKLHYFPNRLVISCKNF